MKKLVILLGLLPLSACISFGAKPPPSLLDLTATQGVPVGQVQDGATAKSITIQVPSTPQSVATARVPVQASPTSIAYVKDALWVEPPARLFARLLSDTIAANTGRVVLSPAQSFADPGARLSGELRSFGVDAATSSALVIFDAALIRSDAGTVEKRRFEARVPLATIDAPTVGPALNQGANQVAADVASWVGR